MIVTKVKLTPESTYIATINGIEYGVPDDMNNRHRRKIQEWIDEGNTPEPASDPPLPLTASEEIARQNRVIRALIKVIATLEGVPTSTIVNMVKNEMELL